MSRTDWLDLLIDPMSVVGTATEPAARRGLGYLFEGRFLEYMLFAEQHRLPKLGETLYEEPEIDQELLESVSLYLGGNEDAAKRLDSLLANPDIDPDLRTVVAVLVSMLQADAMLGSEAVGTLQTAYKRAERELTRAILLLHMGVRLAELGDPAGALEQTRAVTELITPEAATRTATAIAAVAQTNLQHFSLLAGTRPTETAAGGLESPVLTAVMSTQVDALRSYLEERFDLALSDPNTVSVSFRSLDLIDSRLSGALLRSECLADWGELQAVRRVLGRYRLLVSVGIPDRSPDAAFHLLRRAGDAQGLTAAVRTYLRHGPLPPVIRLTSRVAHGPWLAIEGGTVLGVLEQAAELLGVEDAARAATRILTKSMGDVEAARGYDLLRDMDALRSVIQVTDGARAGEALDQLLDLARRVPNSALLQGLARLTPTVRWEHVPNSTVDAWTAYVSESLLPLGDAHLLALSTAGPLARLRPKAIAVALGNAFRTSRNLAIGAVLVSVVSTPERRDAKLLADEAVASMRTVRSDAGQGRFGFGVLVDPALVLATLLVEGKRKQGWAHLTSFLVDPLVAWHHKLPAYTYLADHVNSIPERFRTRFTRGVEPTVDDARSLFVAGSQVFGAQLRMAFALGAADENAVLAGALRLAVSDQAIDRLEACSVLEFALQRSQSDALMTLVLALAQDANPEVRAAGGAALAVSIVAVGGRLATLVGDRLTALLGEPGVAGPRRVLEGLIRAAEHDVRPIRHLIPILTHLMLHHPSAAVRYRAARLLRVIDSVS